jgi:hypothetical protein
LVGADRGVVLDGDQRGPDLEQQGFYIRAKVREMEQGQSIDELLNIDRQPRVGLLGQITADPQTPERGGPDQDILAARILTAWRGFSLPVTDLGTPFRRSRRRNST